MSETNQIPNVVEEKVFTSGKKFPSRKSQPRKQRDSKRAEGKREIESMKTIDLRSAEITAKYVVANVEAVMQTAQREIRYKTQLQQSSRGIGLATASVVKSIQEAKRPPPCDQIPLFSLFRVGLACYELKMTQVYLENISLLRGDLPIREFVEDVSLRAKIASLRYLPRAMSSLLEGLGTFSQGDQDYVPTFGPDRVLESGNFVPDAARIVYSNLHTVVLAMSNHRTSAASRRRFYDNNPFPGATYNDIHVLQNPHDICPADYRDTLSNDISNVNLFFTRYQKSLQWITPVPPLCTQKGSPACAVAREEDGRILPGAIETLIRGAYSGNGNEWFSPIKLKGIEWLRGAAGLYREPPSYTPQRYPYWDGVSERVCPLTAIANIADSYNVLYGMYL